MSYKVLSTEVFEDGKWRLISGIEKIDKGALKNIDPAKFFLDGLKSNAIGKVISCVEDSKGLTVTVERQENIPLYFAPTKDAIETLRLIKKVVNSKSTDKKKVAKIELILSK